MDKSVDEVKLSSVLHVDCVESPQESSMFYLRLYYTGKGSPWELRTYTLVSNNAPIMAVTLYIYSGCA